MNDKYLNLYGNNTMEDIMLLLRKEERNQFKRYYGEKILKQHESET